MAERFDAGGLPGKVQLEDLARWTQDRMRQLRRMLEGVRRDGKAVSFQDSTFLEFAILTADPAAPAADNARFYAKLTGGGKVALYARFPTGAVQQISVEP